MQYALELLPMLGLYVPVGQGSHDTIPMTAL